MRFVLTIAIWVVFVGGLFLYTSQRNKEAALALEQVHTPVAEKVQRQITVELTPTFSVEADPFALQTDTPASSLEVRLNGRAVQVESTGISRGMALAVTGINAGVEKVNELFVKASPPMQESSLDHGIRVRVLDGPHTVIDHTLWSSGGGLVAGSVSFELTEHAEGDSSHDH